MKMIFGGVYKRKNAHYEYLNDQRYNIYIPVKYTFTKDSCYGTYSKGQTIYRMVDTYMIDNPCWGDKSFKKRLWFLEQANDGETAYKICFDHSNYYYNNMVTLNSDELNEDEWELLGDLHDYNMTSDDESEDYNCEDLLKYIPLYNEDSYRWGSGLVGSCYVKKNAKKDGTCVYKHALNEYSFDFNGKWSLDKLEAICKDVLTNMTLKRGYKKQVKNTLRKIRKYRQLSKEYDEFCKGLK